MHFFPRNLSNITNSQKKIIHIYNYWKKTFVRSNISEPKNSILYILSHVYKKEKISDLYKLFPLPLNRTNEKQIRELCALRLKNVPIQYIIGEWNFRGIVLKMKSPVFIPRPETEMLVNIVEEHIKSNTKDFNVLDICCGSGAISLSLLNSNQNIKVTAIDQSSKACELTDTNAKLHQLKSRLNIIQYRVTNEKRLQELGDKFDIIVSNPPYVLSADVATVQPEIKLYEDLSALDGGIDGMLIIKSILFLASDKLVHGGKLFLETDPSHPELIKEFIKNYKYLRLEYLRMYKDFCNKDRFVVLEKI